MWSNIICYDNAYTTADTEPQHESEFKLTKTPHISPWQESYGMLMIRRILDKIDHTLIAPHCISINGNKNQPSITSIG